MYDTGLRRDSRSVRSDRPFEKDPTPFVGYGIGVINTIDGVEFFLCSTLLIGDGARPIEVRLNGIVVLIGSDFVVGVPSIGRIG